MAAYVADISNICKAVQIYILVLDPQWPQQMTGNAHPFNLIGPDRLIDNDSF